MAAKWGGGRGHDDQQMLARLLEGSNHCREWLVEEAVRHVTGGAGGGQVGKGDGRASARKREVGWCR